MKGVISLFFDIYLETYRMGVTMKLRQALREAESDAAKAAHKLGLISKGWGYWGIEDGPVIAKTVKGKLEKIDDDEPKSTKKTSGGKSYDSWQKPEMDNLKQEYDVEYQHHVKQWAGNIWPKFEDFMSDVNDAKVVNVTPELDRKISNRSHTRNKKELIDLISGYASWPQYRNEKTLQNLYDRVGSGESLNMPLVLKTRQGLRIMAGNTRMDVAQHMGATPKALVIDISDRA